MPQTLSSGISSQQDQQDDGFFFFFFTWVLAIRPHPLPLHDTGKQVSPPSGQKP